MQMTLPIGNKGDLMPTTETKTEPTLEKINTAVEAILTVLGTPETELHQEALSTFHAGNYDAVRWMAGANLSDYFCKSLGYLCGAFKITPTTPTVLAEAARAAAEFAGNKEREKALRLLGSEIQKIIQ